MLFSVHKIFILWALCHFTFLRLHRVVELLQVSVHQCRWGWIWDRVPGGRSDTFIWDMSSRRRPMFGEFPRCFFLHALSTCPVVWFALQVILFPRFLNMKSWKKPWRVNPFFCVWHYHIVAFSSVHSTLGFVLWLLVSNWTESQRNLQHACTLCMKLQVIYTEGTVHGQSAETWIRGCAAGCVDSTNTHSGITTRAKCCSGNLCNNFGVSGFTNGNPDPGEKTGDLWTDVCIAGYNVRHAEFHQNVQNDLEDIYLQEMSNVYTQFRACFTDWPALSLLCFAWD